MMEKRVIVITCSAALIALAACASVKVTTQYNQDATFAEYKSYYFAPPQRQQGRDAVRNPILNKNILNEIKPILEGKGFSEAASREEADFLVIFYAAVKNQQDFVPPSYAVGRWGRVWRTSPGHVVRYKEGTLVIDIVDIKKKELVWQGVGRGVLNRENPEQNFVQAVEKILEEFPPQ